MIQAIEVGRTTQERIPLGLFLFEKRRTQEHRWSKKYEHWSLTHFMILPFCPAGPWWHSPFFHIEEHFSSYVELRPGNALLWQQLYSRMSLCLNLPATSWRMSSRYGMVWETIFVQVGARNIMKTWGKKCVKLKKANIEVIIVAADLCAVSKASCCFL